MNRQAIAQVRRFVKPFLTPLARLQIPYMITGGMAVVLYGAIRAARDVDVVVAPAARQVQALGDTFASPAYEREIGTLESEVEAQDCREHRLTHRTTGLTLSLSMVSDDLDRWALSKRRPIRLGGATICIAPVEYVVLRKLEVIQLGVTRKPVEDIRSLFQCAAGTMDRDFMARQINDRDLGRAWAKIIPWCG